MMKKIGNQEDNSIEMSYKTRGVCRLDEASEVNRGTRTNSIGSVWLPLRSSEARVDPTQPMNTNSFTSKQIARSARSPENGKTAKAGLP